MPPLACGRSTRNRSPSAVEGPASGRRGTASAVSNSSRCWPVEISSELGKSTVLTLRPAEFERYILPFLISALSETFAESSHLLGPLPRGTAVEKAHDRLCRRLLCVGREWH